jgi:hypothetical protein
MRVPTELRAHLCESASPRLRTRNCPKLPKGSGAALVDIAVWYVLYSHDVHPHQDRVFGNKMTSPDEEWGMEIRLFWPWHVHHSGKSLALFTIARNGPGL